MPEQKLILDHVYDHEAAHPDKVFLTQPTGGGKVSDYTWSQVMDQARRMATHLQSKGLGGSQIAILSKNCAHFFMAELAIWMAGGTTVAIFPTEGADTIKFVLDHSDAKFLFVGKLDSWEQQAPGVPADMPCIAFPLAPRTKFDTWDSVVGNSAPMAGRPHRNPEDLAMIIYTSGSTGQPKGVMHSFGRITAATEGFLNSFRPRVPADMEWRVLSYLHVRGTL